MCTECTLNLKAIDNFRSCPTFGGPQYNHWPARSCGVILVSCIHLYLPDTLNCFFQGASHKLMHLLRLIAFHKVRGPPTASQKLFQFIMLYAGKDGRVADLKTIEVQYR